MKIIKTSLAIGLIVLVYSACKKTDSSTTNSYPKQVSITYRVTGTSVDSLNLITYKNETGGITTVTNPRLPFAKTITKTVNRYDIMTMGYFVNPAKTIKMDILVNNQLVKSQENASANSSMSYTFE